ncbi:hypothetical protein, partial [Salisediminibacterium halotolerans]|uniref:hypothetical protein n=1 Tax=Salisediminibacterium halotolerans TaxID=517425 RepID=UPI001C42F86D
NAVNIFFDIKIPPKVSRFYLFHLSTFGGAYQKIPRIFEEAEAMPAESVRRQRIRSLPLKKEKLKNHKVFQSLS